MLKLESALDYLYSQNIGFMGVFKLIFKPLVDEFPYFGAVCYSLMEKKNMDFTLKVVGGELSAILGISDAIEGHDTKCY
ncbi:unnamed protein product [Camellia sinensis]